MRTRFPFVLSWAVDENELPPYHFFPVIEFLFKIIQWSVFVAFLSYTANRIGSHALNVLANFLNATIAVAFDERIGREVWGRVQINRKAHPLLISIGIIVIVVPTIYGIYKLNLGLQHIIADMISSYART